ncbi:MAG: hypothetical protein HXS54_00170 [Theionarchaea archaeon]|nr:hypothetical protein [Theionarchaea archaeon]
MMETEDNLPLKRKSLLQYLGTNPNVTNEELTTLSKYKNPVYASTVKRKLKRDGYVAGPYYDVDLGRFAKNRLTRLFAVLMFRKDYPFIINLLRKIDCFVTLYPVFEQSFKMLIASFVCSDELKLKNIFDWLLEQEILVYFDLYVQKDAWYLRNPSFITERRNPVSLIPSLDGLLDEIEIPDLSLGTFCGITLNRCDLSLIEDLFVGIGECNLRKISRYERKRENLFFTYSELKLSMKKLLEHRIISRYYNVYPFPRERCSRFILLMRSSEKEKTQLLLFNFGKNARLQERLTYWKSLSGREEYGVVQCACHPSFLIKLLQNLDKYEEIEDKKFYFLRSFPASYWVMQAINTRYYNTQTQELFYPYEDYLEEIKKAVTLECAAPH